MSPITTFSGNEAAFASFAGLPHRSQTVAEIGGVAFVNDSKATNADAARQALASYPAVFWIAGGKAKDGGGLMDAVKHALD